MNKLLFLFIVNLMTSVGAYSQVSTHEKVKIKEIKELVNHLIPEAETCLDEYFIRRHKLLLGVTLTPVIGVGEVAVGTYAGLGVGAAVANTLVYESWGQLGALIGGGMIGFGIGVSAFVTSTTVLGVKFAQNDKLIKWIGEVRLDKTGKISQKMHKQYLKKYPEDNLTMDEMNFMLEGWDNGGLLCDGSLVKPRRFKNGKFLKQRLALKKEIFFNMHEALKKKDV